MIWFFLWFLAGTYFAGLIRGNLKEEELSTDDGELLWALLVIWPVVFWVVFKAYYNFPEKTISNLKSIKWLNWNIWW